MKAIVYIRPDGKKNLICCDQYVIDEEYICFQKDGKNNYARYLAIVYKTDDYNADRIVCEEFLK